MSGASVVYGNNGKQAIDKLSKSERKFDAILMDIQMPIMDGYKATRIIRGIDASIPIIAFTAHAMKDEQEKVKKAGFSDYLTKPVSRVELIQTLCKLLS